MKRKTILLFILFLPILIPLFSFLFWWIQYEKPLKILIYDMTVPYLDMNEHKSLSWILIHEKFTTLNKVNQPDLNYKGFFPLSDFKFITKDFLKLTREEVFQVADSLDMAYYTDTYGVYTNEWYNNKLFKIIQYLI